MFALNDATSGAPLRYLGIDLLNRYGVIHKFKVGQLSASACDVVPT